MKHSFFQTALAFARSALFSVLYFFWGMIASVVGYAFSFIPDHRPIVWSSMVWARGVTLMENIVLGLDYKMLGMENFPPPPFIAAIQHQSAWETVKLLYWFKWPAVVMKAELGRIPFWGACSRRYGSIFVERSRKLEDLRHFVDSAKARVAQKRNVVLFPQGTRSLPEAPAKVQKGFVLLYEALNIPVVPMTLDSGKFWPRKSFIKYPGTITVTVHPPIMPGQPREEVLAKLEALYAYRP